MLFFRILPEIVASIGLSKLGNFTLNIVLGSMSTTSPSMVITSSLAIRCFFHCFLFSTSFLGYLPEPISLAYPVPSGDIVHQAHVTRPTQSLMIDWGVEYLVWLLCF